MFWPETSVPAFFSEINEPFLKPLSEEAAKNHSDVITSMPLDENPSGNYYNAVITLGSDSRIYKKTHLLPFGEYLPWQPVSWIYFESYRHKARQQSPAVCNNHY